MIKNWFIAKRAEIKVKMFFYTTISKVIEENEDILLMIKNIYESCKGLSGDDIRDEIVLKIAELVHEQAKEDNTSVDK